MSKKRAKRSVPSSNPLTDQSLYSKPAREEYRGIIFGLILCLAGSYVFFTTKIDNRVPIATIFLIGGLLLLGILVILSTFFGTLQSINLDGENLIFSYRSRNKIYKAGEVMSIAQGTSVDLGSTQGILINFLGSFRRFRRYYPEPAGNFDEQYYRHYVTLFITLKDGTKIEIPGSSKARINVKRVLLNWRARYNPPKS
jgi:hypothetical protein